MFRRAGKAGAWGAVGTVAVHGAAAVALVTVTPSRERTPKDQPVAMEIVRRPPPPPPAPPPVELPQKPPAPRRVVRSSLPKPVAPPTPTAAPPPPAEAPKPETPPAPPVFGVRLDSTVSGDSPVAVPVGNTLPTRDRTPAPAGVVPKPYAAQATGDGTDPNAFSPVAEMYIGEFPTKVKEVEPVFPPEARRLGLLGVVNLRVGVDKTGRVRSVKVMSRAGNGFDESATKALWQYRFTPCKLKSGEAVDCVIPYRVRFQSPDL